MSPPTNGVNGHSQTTGDQYAGKPPNWEPLLQQAAFTPTRKLRVVCVGAGMSGMMVAWYVYHGMKLQGEIDLAIYDRNPDIGGTWLENTYPGASSDVPAHVYVFPFEGNPDWNNFYAKQPDIQAYIKRTAAKWDLTRDVQLNTKILSTIWDEDSAKWKIKLEQNGEVKDDEADFLINGSGFLNKWKWPDVPGRDVYKGKLLHSARWDNDWDWTGKKVAVLGNGNSGIQIVSEMSKTAGELVNYMRQGTWISPNFLDDKTPQGVNFAFTEEQKKKWREDPKALLEYRRDLEQAVNIFFYCMVNDTPQQQFYEKICRERMVESLKGDPDLQEKIIPKWHAGCRRITPGDGYLEALQTDNCRASFNPIERFTETGILHKDGTEEAFDAIICATGFDPSWHPQWDLVGRDGARIEKMWSENPSAFLATQVAHIPNYAMINGPNPPISHGSVPTTMSWATTYILGWIQRMAREDIRSVCVRQSAVDDYTTYAQEFLSRTAWADPCRTLYKRGRDGGAITGVYPGSMVHYKRALEAALHQGENFHIDWRSRNRFRCLGNGFAESDDSGNGNLAPYMVEENYIHQQPA